MSESNVHTFGLSKSSRESVDFPRVQDHTDFSDGNGGGGDMYYHKIKKLEKDVRKIKGGIKYIQATGATKMDLHQEISAQTRVFTNYVIMSVLAVVGLAVAIATLVVTIK
ncbi:hypothetical protein G3755_004057 [Salmonella enterica]|uniref:hypothetical protein n=1 Tax=Salmonella enterica TaxID=28901 RepID=UPI00127BFCAE|nr:hypothetical protein [Salmonella enterica]EAO5523873.1 hypothetical protein [Salmonella enterica subsp. enterica serovar Hvittingfoss]EAS0616498.1 hypothetical protein [Salmonella enterica]EAW9081683.1 hypothetical protein [Salmonella enterica]EBA1657925.1 hypothetical protein [Salmonella enterica]